MFRFNRLLRLNFSFEILSLIEKFVFLERMYAMLTIIRTR
jgi:hypothetical protein